MRFTNELKNIILSIERDNKIIKGENKLFFANESFNFFGLEILENSLVYNSGKVIHVNLIPFGVLINKQLVIIDDIINYEGYSGGRFLWDKDNFDFYTFGNKTCIEFNLINNVYEKEFPGSCAYPYLDLVKNTKVLSWNNINFSSLAYTFNYNNDNVFLSEFINMDDYLFETKFGKTINIPSFIQVDLKTNYFFPLLEVNLYGIYTIFDFCYIKTTDKLYFGSISKDLVTKRIDNKSGYELTHQAGSSIEIDLDGIIYWEGFVKDRIESCRYIVK